MRRCSFVGTLVLALLLVLTTAPVILAQSPVSSPVASPTTDFRGIQLADMDLSIDPARDFYQFANGGWLARTEIPADSSSFGVFDALIELTDQQQLSQLEELMQDPSLEVGSDEWKAVAFFQQGVDMETRNAQGIAPVQPQLDVIASATNLQQLHELMASDAFSGIPDFFNIGATPDPANASMTSAYVAAPRLGLPDVTYYTDDSESNRAVREAYKAAAAQLFQLTGMSEAEATEAAQAVYALEARFAADMVSPVEAQDYAVIYNPMTLDELQALYPALDWQAYMTSIGATVDGSSVVINSERDLMEKLAGILETTDFQTIKNYLTLQMLWLAAPYLDQTVRDIEFGFNQALYGEEEQTSIDKDVLGAVNRLMPDALGRLYVAEYFSPESKAEIEELVEHLIDAFRVRIENNTWMSDETKIAALEKLDAIRVKVGYPDTWQSYADYVVGDSYWATVKESRAVASHQRMAKYGQPVDRSEWGISVQTVNAGYSAESNDITFPAAILQAPFFDPQADPASNYGAIGYVIGHEITHAFDLQGSQFDKDGNYRNWWTAEDLAAFQALNEQVVAEYGAVEVLPGLFVNGQLTVTENVADLGGLQVAHDALQLALQDEGDPGVIDGFTQDQRFFIAAAQVWRGKTRDAFQRLLLQSDPHAPRIVRATLPARNMDAFYAAFPEIQPADPMYLPPTERVVVW